MATQPKKNGTLSFPTYLIEDSDIGKYITQCESIINETRTGQSDDPCVALHRLIADLHDERIYRGLPTKGAPIPAKPHGRKPRGA